MPNGKAHKQATPKQIAELRARLDKLEASGGNAMVFRYRWYLSDRVLHRFITARNGNVDLALEILLNHLDWRADYGMDTILEEDLSHEGLDREFYWSGFDLEGRPCLVFRAAMHRKSDSAKDLTPEQKIRYYCQLLERGFRDYSPAFKFCLVLDCRGAGRENMDRKLMKIATPVIENNFPETQHATYVVPCGPVIMMAWRFMSGFIDPGTAEKIKLLPSFDDPSLAGSFTPETLEAFVTQDPSKASPQPYVEPDPLGNAPTGSGSSTAVSEQVDNSTLEGAPTVTSVSAANSAPHAPFIASVGAQPSNPAPPSTAGFSMPPPSPEGSFEDMSPMGDSSFDRNPIVSGYGGVSPGVSPCSPSGSFASDEGHPAKKGSLGSGVSRCLSSGLDGESTTAVPSAAGSASLAGSMSAMGSMSGRRVSAGNSQSFSNSPADDVERRAHGSGGQVMPPGQGLDEGPAAAAGWGRGEGLESTSAASSSTANPAPVRGSHRLDRPPLAGLGADHANVRGSRNLTSEASAVEGGVRAPGLQRGAGSYRSGGLGARDGSLLGEAEGMARRSSALGSDEVAQKVGYLHKRRDTLRGRFAYRRRYAVLRFPPGSTNVAATGDLAGPGGNHPHNAPTVSKTDPPTLALFKTSGEVKSEKVISLEGAEVKLGRSKAGDLYPFVVVFTNSQRQHQHNYVHEAREPAPSRRNTEDFTFPGSGMAPKVTSSVAGRSRLASASGELDGINEDVDEEDEDDEDDENEDDPRASGRFVFPGRVFGSLRDVTRASNGGGAGARRYPSLRQGRGADSFSLSPSRSRSTTLPLPDVSSAMVAGNGKGGGRPLRHSTTTRRTLHLACETEEETLEWVRRIDEAAVRYKVSTAASSVRHAEGDVETREEKTTSLPLRGSGGGGTQGSGTGAGAGGGAAGVETEEGLHIREARHLSLGAKGGVPVENGASMSYRYKYAQALAALAAATNDLAFDGEEDAEEGQKKRRSFNIMEAFRKGKTAGLLPDLGLENGKKDQRSNNQPEEKDGPPQVPRDSDRIGCQSDNGDASGLPAMGIFRRNGSFRRLQAGSSAPATPAKSRGVGIRGRRNKRDAGVPGPIVGGDGRKRAGGDVRDSLMSMRDLEISRLRRAYAKAELSRGEMKQCLRALALQLREGEDRTGSLLADREALATEVNAKDAELREKEAVLEERDSRATSEAQAKEEMLTNLKSENQALQAALERLRLDYREQRSGSGSRHGSGGITNDGAMDGAGGVPGIVGGGGRNRRNTIGILRGTNREGLLPPRPSSNHGSQIPVAHRVNAAGNGCGASAAGVVATQCSLLGGGGSGGIRSEMTSCCSGSSAVQTCPSSNGIRLGNSPSDSVRSAESTAVSSYSNCSVAVSIPGMAQGVCGVGNDADGVGSDGGQGDLDEMGRPWIGDGNSVGAAEDWDEEEVGESEGIEDDWQPWILNGDEEQEVVVHRRPREVLSSLLKSLEEILSERDGSLGKRNLADEEFFKNWERGTEELQGLRRPEEVDLMGEKAFTEGCLKLLTQHAAIVLGKDAQEPLTEKEACRMAYAVGGDVYTIKRLEQHLAALVAGLPTE